MPGAATRGILHATAVAVDGQGVLIMGASGTGKSSLALAMIGLGAQLVSDDQATLDLRDSRVILGCPAPDLRGVIEVRGMGLMRAPAVDHADLALVINLDAHETQRLPPTRTIDVLGRNFPLVRNPDHAHFPIALMLQLRHGRHA